MPRRTPLHATHLAAGARMVEFAGWEMPLQYEGGALEEHRAVRRSAGLFDVSHMARFTVRDSGDGSAALGYLQRLVSADLSRVAPLQSTYALLCNEVGGTIDDLFLYNLGDHWLVVANASNREKDLAWMRAALPRSGVELGDVSEQTAMLAFQGPRSIEVTDSLTEGRTGSIARFSTARDTIGGCTVLIGRTGYTGEDGVELFLYSGDAVAVWRTLLEAAAEAGVECSPIGLAARDSLRFEPGFALYGHELSEQISPIEARLGWACDLDKEFIGREALKKQNDEGPRRRLATVRMEDRGVPREGFPVLHQGREVGAVASGMYAPTVDACCANVFVPPTVASIGTKLHILIRQQPKQAVVVRRPLYTPAYRGA